MFIVISIFFSSALFSLESDQHMNKTQSFPKHGIDHLISTGFSWKVTALLSYVNSALFSILSILKNKKFYFSD